MRSCVHQGNLIHWSYWSILAFQGAGNMMKEKRKYTQTARTQCLCAKGCKGVRMANVSNRANTAWITVFSRGSLVNEFKEIFRFLKPLKLRLWNGVPGGLQNRLKRRAPQNYRDNPCLQGGIPYFGIMESRDGRGSGSWPHPPPHSWAGSLLGNNLGRRLFHPFWKFSGGGGLHSCLPRQLLPVFSCFWTGQNQH